MTRHVDLVGPVQATERAASEQLLPVIAKGSSVPCLQPQKKLFFLANKHIDLPGNCDLDRKCHVSFFKTRMGDTCIYTYIYIYIYLFINIYNIYIYALKGGLAGQKYKSEIFLRTRGPISKNQSIHLSPSWQPQGNDTESSLDLFGEQTHEDWASPKPPKIDQSSSIHVRINILIDSPVSLSMVYIHYHSVNSLPIFGTRNHFDLAQSYSKFGPASIITIVFFIHWICGKTIFLVPAMSGPLGPHHCQLLFGIEATIVLIPLVAHQVCCIAMENHHKSPLK